MKVDLFEALKVLSNHKLWLRKSNIIYRVECEKSDYADRFSVEQLENNSQSLFDIRELQVTLINKFKDNVIECREALSDTMDDRGDRIWNCNCDNGYIYAAFNYCPICGSRIKWIKEVIK
jgi:hypothetical protein